MKSGKSTHVVLYAAAVVTLSASSAFAQSLDIKPGLWEIESSNYPDRARTCYSAEKIKSGFSPIGRLDPKLDCQHTWSPGANKSIVTRSTCAGAYKMTGEATAVVNGPESITVTARQDFDMDGERHSQSVTTRYRWVAAECGGATPGSAK